MLRPLILGLGLSGKAAFRLLLTKGIVPFTFDDRFKTPINFDLVSLVIISPGFKEDHPLVVKAKLLNKPVISEIEFALRYLQDRILIGVTGSNGKSTMVKKIEHLLVQNGYVCKAFGNIQIPLSRAVLQNIPILVIELSAQQLETTNCVSLDLGVILNIQPNHLDRYITMENYTRAKLKIFEIVKPWGLKMGPEVSAESVLETVAKMFAIDRLNMDQSMQTFIALEHRLEYLGDIFGKKIYNDSKSTTLSSSLFALSKMQGDVQMIMGGRSKGESIDFFAKNFNKGKLKRILAIGEVQEDLERILGHLVEVVGCKTLQNAVQIALQGEGDLLFSPGFASFDQFDSYSHRGEMFKQRIEWEKKMLS
jgi:UDP-N-acetylmuramoylalanine--D-glutamate ligase